MKYYITHHCSCNTEIIRLGYPLLTYLSFRSLYLTSVLERPGYPVYLRLNMPDTPPTRIAKLSVRIAANTARLDKCLAASDYPTPSFDVDAGLGHPVPKDRPDIEALRSSIIDDTTELQRLILGPRDYLLIRMVRQAHPGATSSPNPRIKDNALLGQQAIVRFRLAHSFPVGGEATFAEVAARSQLDEPFVRQVLRVAINQDIFCEPREGVVWQAAAQTCNAVAKWPGSQEPNQTVGDPCRGLSLSGYSVKKN